MLTFLKARLHEKSTYRGLLILAALGAGKYFNLPSDQIGLAIGLIAGVAVFTPEGQ